MKVLVSACLLGDNCKYNGGNNKNDKVIEFCKNKEVLKICPECMAKMSVPRLPIEIKDGKVIRIDGVDLTDDMNKAVDEVERILKDFNPDIAILKARSPSCGYNGIYDGTFTKTLVKDNGKACQKIIELGVKVLTEEDL